MELQGLNVRVVALGALLVCKNLCSRCLHELATSVAPLSKPRAKRIMYVAESS